MALSLRLARLSFIVRTCLEGKKEGRQLLLSQKLQPSPRRVGLPLWYMIFLPNKGHLGKACLISIDFSLGMP